MNPLSDDEAHFCFFSAEFQQKINHLMGKENNSENESFEKFFSQEIFFFKAKIFFKTFISRVVFFPHEVDAF